MKRYYKLLFLPFLLACSLTQGNIFSSTVEIDVLANDSSAEWINNAAFVFNQSEPKNEAGDTVRIRIVNNAEAGQAIVDMAAGESKPALWVPDNLVWAEIAVGEGVNGYQNDCLSVAESPLVIGMPRQVAETLGWPGRSLGWLDIGSLAADASAWSYYSGGQFGDSLRLGHTHPGLAASGTNTMLALVHSAESKAEAVTVQDIQQPIVQASVGAFEGAVSWFSPSTSALGSAMAERGATYLGAAVMYENTVVTYGDGDLIPIYPFEGTFMATHPACVWEDGTAEQQEAASIFRSWLRSVEGQESAVSFGLRPINDDVAIISPLDERHGVDMAQPSVLFEQPSVETVFAVQDLWQSSRKPINLVMLLDTSGSMDGDKMDGMVEAAKQFVSQMGDDDFITLVEFYTEVDVLISHARIGDDRDKVISIISKFESGGDTSLFDAVAIGVKQLSKTDSPATANVLVVLTDGQDTASKLFSSEAALNNAIQLNTTVFTIAYGRDADESTMQAIAAAANGQFFQGSQADISAIYQEMSAAFGGSVGIGR